jgi:hypothetical protein
MACHRHSSAALRPRVPPAPRVRLPTCICRLVAPVAGGGLRRGACHRLTCQHALHMPTTITAPRRPPQRPTPRCRQSFVVAHLATGVAALCEGVCPRCFFFRFSFFYLDRQFKPRTAITDVCAAKTLPSRYQLSLEYKAAPSPPSHSTTSPPHQRGPLRLDSDGGPNHTPHSSMPALQCPFGFGSAQVKVPFVVENGS